MPENDDSRNESPERNGNSLPKKKSLSEMTVDELNKELEEIKTRSPIFQNSKATGIPCLSLDMMSGQYQEEIHSCVDSVVKVCDAKAEFSSAGGQEIWLGENTPHQFFRKYMREIVVVTYQGYPALLFHYREHNGWVLVLVFFPYNDKGFKREWMLPLALAIASIDMHVFALGKIEKHDPDDWDKSGIDEFQAITFEQYKALFEEAQSEMCELKKKNALLAKECEELRSSSKKSIDDDSAPDRKALNSASSTDLKEYKDRVVSLEKLTEQLLLWWLILLILGLLAGFFLYFKITQERLSKESRREVRHVALASCLPRQGELRSPWNPLPKGYCARA